MSKKKRREIRRAFRRGRDRTRKIRAEDDAIRAVFKGMKMGDAQDLQLEMVRIVLQRLVALQFAQWLDTILKILRDEFGFSEEQLTRFARILRSSDGVGDEPESEEKD